VIRYFRIILEDPGTDVVDFIPFLIEPGVGYSGDYNGLDITYGVNYLKGSISVLIPCPECPPAGL